MLTELHIENLAVIPSASLYLSPGLNVISGETGAGKTILAHAIALLLGIRADSGMIRPGADSASVEAVFELDDAFLAGLGGIIDTVPGEALAVRRKLSRDGRSRTFVGGRSATVAALQELSSRLLAFSAQHEQRSLMLADRQLEILDGFIGNAHEDQREEFALLHDRRLELVAQLEDVSRDIEARQREAELLRYQVDEIEAADLSDAEDETLEQERQRLRNAEELQAAARSLATTVVAGEGGASMKDVLAELSQRLQALAGLDEDMETIAGRLQDCLLELEDLGREASGYAETVIADTARLQEVEERLDIINRLKRKYGGSVEAVRAFALTAAEELDAIQGGDRDEKRMRRELEEVDAEMGELALTLRRARQEAAGKLEEETAGHLRDLSFSQCGFHVVLEKVEGDGALSVEAMHRGGADIAEFTVTLNPGMPAMPLRKTASGGELSRIMLAIKSAVSARAGTETLVFDEIDAGIGGETGHAVGAKLKGLSSGSQVICITHLPQIACFADAHFTVVKHSPDAASTATDVTRLDGDAVVDEICRMMGSDPGDREARAHADSLLNRSASC